MEKITEQESTNNSSKSSQYNTRKGMNSLKENSSLLKNFDENSFDPFADDSNHQSSNVTLQSQQILQENILQQQQQSLEVENENIQQQSVEQDSQNMIQQQSNTNNSQQQQAKIPKKRNKKFTPEEDLLLERLIGIHGKNWKVLSSYIEGKSQAMVRNRYYARIRIQKQKDQKIQDKIKLQSQKQNQQNDQNNNNKSLQQQYKGDQQIMSNDMFATEIEDNIDISGGSLFSSENSYHNNFKSLQEQRMQLQQQQVKAEYIQYESSKNDIKSLNYIEEDDVQDQQQQYRILQQQQQAKKQYLQRMNRMQQEDIEDEDEDEENDFSEEEEEQQQQKKGPQQNFDDQDSYMEHHVNGANSTNFLDQKYSNKNQYDPSVQLNEIDFQDQAVANPFITTIEKIEDNDFEENKQQDNVSCSGYQSDYFHYNQKFKKEKNLELDRIKSHRNYNYSPQKQNFYQFPQNNNNNSGQFNLFQHSSQQSLGNNYGFNFKDSKQNLNNSNLISFHQTYQQKQKFNISDIDDNHIPVPSFDFDAQHQDLLRDNYNNLGIDMSLDQNLELNIKRRYKLRKKLEKQQQIQDLKKQIYKLEKMVKICKDQIYREIGTKIDQSNSLLIKLNS